MRLLSLMILLTPTFGWAEPGDADAVLRALRDDQAAARDALDTLHRGPLAEQATAAAMRDLDDFWAKEGKQRLVRASILAQRQVRSVAFEEGALSLMLAELHTVVGGSGVEAIAERFAERAKAPIARVLDRHLGTLREVLDAAITEAVGAQMKATQDRFDAALAARFPAWSAAIVVPVLPAPEVMPTAVEARTMVDGGRKGRWAARAGLIAAPMALRMGAGIGRALSAKASQRAVQAVASQVGGRLLSVLSGIGAIIAAADTLIDLATIQDRYKDELVKVMALALRRNVTPAVVWRGPAGPGEPSARADVAARIDAKLHAWLDVAHERSQRVIDTAPALAAPQARAFIERAVAEGADRPTIIARLGAIQRTFGRRLTSAHALPVLEDLMVQGDHAVVATLADRLGDQLIALHQAHGPDFLRAAERLGPEVLVEALRDPAVDWQAAAAMVPPGAPAAAVQGALTCLRMKVDCRQLGLSLRDLARIGSDTRAAEALLKSKVAPREALSVLLDKRARAGVVGLDQEALLLELAGPLGPQRMRRIGEEPKLAKALALVYREAEETGHWDRADRGTHLEQAWTLAPVAVRHGAPGLRVWRATIGEGGEVREAEAQRALALLERVPAEVLIDPAARRMLLDHAGTFYGDLVVAMFRWTGTWGTWALKGLLFGLLLIPLAILWRMLKLLVGPPQRRRQAVASARN